MQAVLKTGGKQYRVKPGDILKVEKLEAELGSTIEFDEVLMVHDENGVKVGAPFLAGTKVSANVVGHGRGEKIRIIKFKRRKHHLKRQGHLQYFTQVEITAVHS